MFLAAEQFKQALEIGFEQMQGALLMRLKIMAVHLMNSSLEQLIGGVNGSGLLYISDWRQHLIAMPEEANKIFVEDYLSQTTRGKCSSINFEVLDPSNVFDSKNGGYAKRSPSNPNYQTLLCSAARRQITGKRPVVNIDQYSANPAHSLREGDWRVLNALYLNPANNPIGYAMLVEAARAQDLAERKRVAEAEAIANQGYNAVKVGGVTVTPGRTVGDIVENIKTLPNNIWALSNKPGEILGGLVVSVANRAMNQMLQRGFDVARTKIQREITKVNTQIYKTSREINKKLGPASLYLEGVNQQLGNINNARIPVKTGGGPPDCSNAGPNGAC